MWGVGGRPVNSKSQTEDTSLPEFHLHLRPPSLDLDRDEKTWTAKSRSDSMWTINRNGGPKADSPCLYQPPPRPRRRT